MQNAKAHDMFVINEPERIPIHPAATADERERFGACVPHSCG
jgi:hypothetical protein